MLQELSALQNSGVDAQALVLLLSIPVVSTIIGIARHIIGVKSLGIYTSLILTYSYFALGLTQIEGGYSDVFLGVRNGIVFTTIVILANVLGTSLLKGARIHYFPKIALVLSFVAVTLVGTILLADVIGKKGFSSTNALALVMLASISESFTSVLLKKKIPTALLYTVETVVTSIFCYVLIAWISFQETVLKYPYIILITLLINYIVGKYKGLRFQEYFRFEPISESVDKLD